ncbi:Leucine-rich repeat-containing protein 43 [Acipenser ruthenus]|uniref:Leucine-rich repeat-containing protein 43 n=1 Tax=Acipenser ruthenus TaxID=7906 RepID=A0A444UZ59_ACIRT|nr:Leucine-rich repeat-containing protein 43 [Acipenser ruthenus]
MNKYSVYTAFQEQLQTLCLKEFPCGFGSWNKTHFDSGTCSGSTVPLLEDPALGTEEEEPASLIEYLSSVHSPWHLSESWGPAADQLRELAVRSPALIDTAFILSYFRSLRIVDKGSTNTSKQASDLIVDEAKVIVSIGTVQGIPNPVNPVETETPPEYPIVSYSYHVTYEFLNDHPLSTTDEETADQAKKTPTCCDSERTNNSVQSSQQHQESTHEESRNPSADTAPPAGNMTPGPPQNKVPEDDSSVLLHCTPKVPWAGQIESEYRKVHLQRDLPSLKQFLLRGMQVTVVEQKVLSWPAITTESVSAKADSKGGAKADKGKEKGKKKKEPVALRHDAPICRTLGSLRVKLESLLLGENHLESLCDFGVLIKEQAAKALPGKTCCDSERTNNSVQSSQQHQESTHEESRNPSADTAPPAGNMTPGPPQNKNKTHFDSGTCSGSTVPLLEDPALGAEEEEPASLIEYLSSVHSPWHLSESWGPAADQLRELAVRSPALIDTAFIMSYFRPVLLSLDLSFNNLVDLPDLVCKLSSLSRLRTLVLMGNPLALTPSYRGFLVDSLPKLALLDDVRVLPDERHHFKGLAKRKGSFTMLGILKR